MPDDRAVASALARHLSGMGMEDAGVIARLVSAARRRGLSPGLPHDAVSGAPRNASLCCRRGQGVGHTLSDNETGIPAEFADKVFPP